MKGRPTYDIKEPQRPRNNLLSSSTLYNAGKVVLLSPANPPRESRWSYQINDVAEPTNSSRKVGDSSLGVQNFSLGISRVGSDQPSNLFRELGYNFLEPPQQTPNIKNAEFSASPRLESKNYKTIARSRDSPMINATDSTRKEHPSYYTPNLEARRLNKSPHSPVTPQSKYTGILLGELPLRRPAISTVEEKIN